MSRFAIAFVPVVVLWFGQAAVGQVPFVENFYQPNISSLVIELDGDETGYVDIPDSGRSVTIPAGRVIFIWQSRHDAPIPVSIRPAIGDITPDEGLYLEGHGSWSTVTDGGSFDVRLQAYSELHNWVNLGGRGRSWTLIVFPDAKAGVPVVSDVGLVAMVIVLLAVGGYVIARRQQPLAA